MLLLLKLLNKRYVISMITICLAFGMFLFFIGGAVPVIIKNYEQKNEVQLLKFIHDSDVISKEIQQSLKKLNSYRIKSCDSALLDRMRLTQFEANYIKDIGYSDNNQLICTSGLGLLKKPFDEIAPDLILPDGSSLWIDVPIKLFNFAKKANVIKTKHFNAVYSAGMPEKADLNLSNMAVYIQTKQGKPHFYAGNCDIAADSKNGTTLSLHGITTVKCSKVSYVCAAAYTSYSEIASQERNLIFGIVMLSFLSSAFISRYFYDKMIRFRGFDNRFRYGMTYDRVKCFYQPIVELETGIIIGCEVLCRWEDNDGSIVTPDKFLHLIKKMNRTFDFTKIIVDKTFAELSDVIKDHRYIRISFNIFPNDFSYDRINRLLRKYKHLYPDITINLELTEDELVELSSVSKAIDMLRGDGYVVSIDDFGTGYSSLSYLREINADFIKIDRSFVKEIEHGAIRANLIPNIVQIASDLGICVIAEGIENKQQEEYLSGFNVLYGQGYFYSRPCPVVDFSKIFCGNKLC